MSESRAAHPSDSINKQKPFITLTAAININNIDAIQAATISTPTIFLEKDNLGNTLLHYAALSGSVKCIQIISDHLLKIEKFNDIIAIQNIVGDTPLHIAAVLNTAKVVQELVKNASNVISLITNNEGKTSLQVAAKNTLEKEQPKIQAILLRLSLDYSIKSLSTPVDMGHILKSQPEVAKNPILMRHMKLACKVLNMARADIDDSATHPQTNAYSNEKKIEIGRRNSELRDKFALLKTPKECISQGAQLIKKAKVANCAKLSYLVLSNCMALPEAKDVRVNAVGFKNADHAFNIIGLPDNYDLNKLETYGDAVICDAWCGEVYPAKDLHQKLMAYYGFNFENKSYNLLAQFNQNHHRFFSIVSTDNLIENVSNVSLSRVAPTLFSQVVSKKKQKKKEELIDKHSSFMIKQLKGFMRSV